MSTEANKVIVRKFVAAADRQDFDHTFACLSPDVVVHRAVAPGPLDFPTFFQFGKMWHGAFPDEQMTFEDQIAEGEKVVSRMASTATHTGEFQGIPPTGKQIRVTGKGIERIADGKIVERWGVVGMLGVMQQLGVVPMS